METEETNKIDVDLKIINMTIPKNKKKVLGWCDVDINISGLLISICGIAITSKKGVMQIITPQWIDERGKKHSHLKLPRPIAEEIAQLVMQQFVEG